MKSTSKLLPVVVAALCACADGSIGPVSPELTRRAELSASLTGNTTIVVAEGSVVRQAENTVPTNNWVLYTRVGTAASAAQFIIGPDTPPLGVGSYQSQLASNAEKAWLFNYDHVGTALSSITGLSYATYNNNAAVVALPSINIQIDVNGGTFVPGEFRTLVYEPYQQAPSFVNTPGIWRSWDAYNGGVGLWWSTGATSCPQGAPCTWTALVASYPGATILGGFGINAGSGNAGLDASTDALSIEYGGGSVTYDFDPYVTPSSKESCKNGGWLTVTRSDGSPFKNQGDCVSFFNNGR